MRDQPKIQDAKRAEATIYRDSETTRSLLQTIGRQLQAEEAARNWNLWIVLFFAGVALLSGLGMVQAYLGDSRARAEDAEGQRQRFE